MSHSFAPEIEGNPSIIETPAGTVSQSRLAEFQQAARLRDRMEPMLEGHVVAAWEKRLQRLFDCDAEMDERHEGYAVALGQCLSDLRRLAARPGTLQYLPTPPDHWKSKGRWGPTGVVYGRRWLGQNWTVIVDTSMQLDGRPWAHVSCSRRDRCPTWEEMAAIKTDFLGDIGAIQVAPTKDRHINLHGTCLHWWAPLDHWPLPDFAWGGDSI